jgi:hypothetical protein
MDQNRRVCKKCNILKQRIETGKFDARNKKFIDESGLLWNGSVCGSCNRERVKLAMRIKRNVKET